MIPKQLIEEGFRFIKVRNNKAPIEVKWQDTNNYSYDDKKFLSWLKENKRYGVVTGYNNLGVIDFDNADVQEKVLPLLPETFTVKTAGRGLLHLYYFIDKPKSMKVLDINNDTIADIQGTGKQVIGANSMLDNGKKYEIVKDIPINSIKMELINKVFAEWIDVEKQIEKRKDSDDDCIQIKGKVKVPELLSGYGIDTSKNPTSCPFHSSKGGRCFSYNDEIWHCFHCGKRGNAFHLVMEKDNITFIEAKEKLAARVGIALRPRVMLKITNFLDNTMVFFQQKPFFYDKYGIFWVWVFESNKYEIVDDVDMMILLEKALSYSGETINPLIKNAYLETFKRVGRTRIPRKAPMKWIQFNDKAFSLESGNIYDITPDYFFTNPIPWNIGKKADTPILDKLIVEWVGEKYKDTMYELIAYCCYANYPIQLIFCLFGSGRNGKGCFLRVLDKFIGNGNVCSTELDMIAGKNKSRFETFKLYKKLVCLMGETNFGFLSGTSMLKKLTGGDKIGFEKKGKDAFDDYSFSKIIIASNSLPSSDDTTDGFYRRWFVIPFENEFPEGKDVTLTIPENEYESLAKKVTFILPGLLARGQFTMQGNITERKKRYILASNPITLFLENCCDVGNELFIGSSELYTAYILFLNKHKKRKVKSKEFKSAMEDEGFWAERTSKKVTDGDGYGMFKSGYWFGGLTLKQDWRSKIYDNCDNYDMIPTHPPILGSGVGNYAQLSQLSQKEVFEELFDKTLVRCYVCGTPESHFYGCGKYFCSKSCIAAFKLQNIVEVKK